MKTIKEEYILMTEGRTTKRVPLVYKPGLSSWTPEEFKKVAFRRMADRDLGNIKLYFDFMVDSMKKYKLASEDHMEEIIDNNEDDMYFFMELDMKAKEYEKKHAEMEKRFKKLKDAFNKLEASGGFDK